MGKETSCTNRTTLWGAADTLAGRGAVAPWHTSRKETTYAVTFGGKKKGRQSPTHAHRYYCQEEKGRASIPGPSYREPPPQRQPPGLGFWKLPQLLGPVGQVPARLRWLGTGLTPQATRGVGDNSLQPSLNQLTVAKGQLILRMRKYGGVARQKFSA